MFVYVELHAASAFSFLEAASTPEALVERAAALGYPALAMLDRDGLYGAPRLHMAARKAGLKALVGAELTIRTQQQAYSPHPPSLWRLPVLVASRDGYRNLCRLITRMKAGRAEGRGHGDGRRPHARGSRRHDRRADRAGRTGRARRRDGAARRRRAARSPGRGVRPRSPLRRAAAAPAARRGGRQPGADHARLGVPRAAPRDQRRPLRRAGGAAAATTSSPASATRPTSIAPGSGSPRNAERYLKSPAEMAQLFADLPEAVARDARARRSARLHDGRSRLPLPRLSGAGGRDAGVVPAQDHRRRRARALPAVSTIAPGPRSPASST